MLRHRIRPVLAVRRFAWHGGSRRTRRLGCRPASAPFQPAWSVAPNCSAQRRSSLIPPPARSLPCRRRCPTAASPTAAQPSPRLRDGPEDARKKLSAVLGKDDASTPAHLWLAETELQAGNSAAAIAQYRKLLEKDSRNLVALNGLGYLLADRANQPDEALKYAQQAKELAPQDPAVEDTLGWVYYCKGLYPVAAGHLEAAVAKEPNARRKYHLAMAYFKSGDRPRGTVQLNQALKMDSTLPEAATAQRMAAEMGGGVAKR